MYKWLISAIVICFLIFFGLKYNAYLTRNSVKQQETVQYKNMGQVIESTREMKDSRKQELEKREKEIDF